MIDSADYNVTNAARAACMFMNRHWPPDPDCETYFDSVIADLDATVRDQDQHPIAWTLLQAALWSLEVEWIMSYEEIPADKAAAALGSWRQQMTPRKGAEIATGISNQRSATSSHTDRAAPPLTL